MEPKVNSGVVTLTIRGAFPSVLVGHGMGNVTSLMVHLIWGHNPIFYIGRKLGYYMLEFNVLFLFRHEKDSSEISAKVSFIHH